MVKQIVPGLWQVPLGSVNAYLIDDGREVVVVDSGLPGSAPKLEAALGEIGRGRPTSEASCSPTATLTTSAARRRSAG